MNENKYNIEKIYYLLLGIKETLYESDYSVPSKVIKQYNEMIRKLSLLADESLWEYKIEEKPDFDDGTYYNVPFKYQLNQVISYIENMHINTSDYQINKVGYLYNSIVDKELHERCGDILLGETAFDRAINQATQILEDRIKKKSGLEKTTLIGNSLISRAIHTKLDQTVLKFSDEADIQEGYSFLFKGLISIYRNPTHHSLNFKCDREYALKFCAYIDELLLEVNKSDKIK